MSCTRASSVYLQNMLQACNISGTRYGTSRVWKTTQRCSAVYQGRLQPLSDRTTGDPSAKKEFRELNLRELDMEWQRVRVRQHVNPLKLSLQQKVGPLDWDSAFADSAKPLVVDIGSGYGRFLLQMALAYPQANFLGLEIREPIIERASEWAKAVGLSDRVQFKLANGTVSTKSMLSSYPGDVVLICVQFPDPHFKRRHRKRHIVQPQFCADVQEILSDHGQLYAASDVQEVAEYMHGVFTTSTPQLKPTGHLSGLLDGPTSTEPPSPELQSIWLDKNPLGVPTEREVHALEQGVDIHRFLLQKAHA